MNKDNDKRMLYDSYERIVDNPKSYNKVSNKAMLEEVYDFYSDYKNILNICSYSEIRLLHKILNKELDSTEIIKDWNYENLRAKLLVFYDNKTVIIPKEIEKSFKEAYKNLDREEQERIETLDVLLIGLLRIYGLLTFKDLYNIVINYLVIDEELLKKRLETDKYFNFYINKTTIKKKEYYVYRSYKGFEDVIYSGIESYKNIDYYLRPFEEIIYLRFNNLNDMNKDIMKLQDEFNKKGINDISIILEIVMDTVLDNDRKELIKKLSKYGDDFIKILNNAMDNMPSACLKGYTRKEYLDSVADKKYDEDYEKIRYDNNIVKYKEVREKTKTVLDEAMYYAFKEKLTDKFNSIVKENNIFFTNGDTEIVTNLVLFHSVDKEETNFNIFYNKKVNIFFPYYDLFKQFNDTYVEGLFNVINVNKKEGFVTLKSMFSKREYKVYDIALSSNKNILNNYLYTSLVTVDCYTFTTDYIFVLGSDKKIIEEIDKKKKLFKDIKCESTKEFLACYEIFRDSNLNLKSRNLE